MAMIFTRLTDEPFDFVGKWNCASYSYDANGSSSGVLTSTSHGLTYIYDAIDSITSATYTKVLINQNSAGSTVNGSITVVPAGAYDTGRIYIMGKQ